MNLDIKLFAHGVFPTGQQTWGVPQTELPYIEAFYGNLMNVPSLLLVEVRPANPEGRYCYYTYIHNNILGRDGRIGTAYFALTIRMNMYYADVVNMHNILEAAYNKWIINSILQLQPDNNERFAITELNAKDADLKSLEKELQHYLTLFSANEDIIPLFPIGVNKTNAPAQYYLLDGTPQEIYQTIKSFGKAAISKFYPCNQLTSYGKKLEEQMKEKERIANEKIQQIQSESAQQVRNAQQDKEESIQNIKQQYANIDKQITELKKQLNIEKENGAQQKNALEMQCDAQKKELEHFYKLIANAQGYKSTPAPTWYTAIKNLHPLTDILVMAILLAIVAVSLPNSDIFQSNDTRILTRVDKQIKNLGSLLSEQIKNATNVIKTEISANRPNVIEIFKKANPNARIDISNIGQNNPMRRQSNNTHEVTLQNAPEKFHGEWTSKDFDILRTTQGKYTLTPKKTGKCTICYTINGVNVIERTIDVQ